MQSLKLYFFTLTSILLLSITSCSKKDNTNNNQNNNQTQTIIGTWYFNGATNINTQNNQIVDTEPADTTFKIEFRNDGTGTAYEPAPTDFTYSFNVTTLTITYPGSPSQTTNVINHTGTEVSLVYEFVDNGINIKRTEKLKRI